MSDDVDIVVCANEEDGAEAGVAKHGGELANDFTLTMKRIGAEFKYNHVTSTRRAMLQPKPYTSSPRSARIPILIPGVPEIRVKK